jgi:hypothetical protein
VKDDLLVKIFAGHLVDKQIILNELLHHQHQHQQTLEIYRAIERDFFTDIECDQFRELRYLTLLNGIEVENAWLSWCDRAIDLLSIGTG